MVIYRNIILRLFILTLCLIWHQAIGQNVIDVKSGGGFSALYPSGEYDDDVTWTDWPEGTLYDGSVANTSFWSSASNYLGQTGSGFIQITQPADTRIFVDGSISHEDGQGENHDTSATIEFNAANNDLQIICKPGSSLANAGHAGVVYVTAANQVGITNGIYSTSSINGTAIGNANFAGNQHTIYISGTSTAYLKNTTIQGSTDVANWVNNITGGTALYLNNVNTAIIDFEDDKTGNSITGGQGEIGEGSNSAISPTGGAAIEISGSTLFATNLFAEGGTAGSSSSTLLRDLSQGTYGANASGGVGIKSSSANLNIHKGEITGSDGGSFLIIVQDAESWNIGQTANGGNGFDGGTGNGTLSELIVNGGNGGSFKLETPSSGEYNLSFNGGDAYSGNFSGGTVIDSEFRGGNGSEDLGFTSGETDLSLSGGLGFENTSSTAGTINNSYIYGGSGGTASIITTGNGNNIISANGGNGFEGAGIINDSVILGGNAGIVAVAGENTLNAAEASGGNGATITGTSEINGNTTIKGGNGGILSVDNGLMTVNGGHGINQTSGTLTINAGSFEGGGSGAAGGLSDEFTINPGYGAKISSSAIISGGTFAAGGTDSSGYDLALYLDNSSSVLLNGSAEIQGDIFLEGNNGNIQLLSGTASGDIIMSDGSSNLDVSDNFNYSGKMIQNGGQITTAIDTESDGSFFQTLDINSGTNIFSNGSFISGNNAQINLNSANSLIDFEQGATLTSGTRVNVGYGKLESGNNVVVDQGSSIDLYYNANNHGIIDIDGDIDLSAENANINITGIASNPNGSVNFGSVNSIINNTNINADLGWLTEITSISSSNNLEVTYAYRSLTNHKSSLLISSNALSAIDSLLPSNSQFEAINNLGESSGIELLRFDETQLPDVASAIIENQVVLHRQFAARAMEMRSLSTLAQSNHDLYKPDGASGPQSNLKPMSTWVRGYGSFGERDQTQTHASHTSSNYGTIVGMDKRYGSLLLGLSGGYSSLDLDGGSIFQTDATGYNQSIYASWNEDSKFVDISVSRTAYETKNVNLITTDEFDATSYGFYVATGKETPLSDKTKMIQEISYQHTQYDQDGYIHDGFLPKDINSYNSSSDLISLGFKIATERKINWFNRNIAMVPEFRARWTHELSPNMNDVTFTYLNSSETSSLNLRSRDENILEIGCGIDFWNWRYFNSKVELDLDYLRSKNYNEKTISGKFTLRF